MKRFMMMAVAVMMAALSVNAQQMFIKPMVGGTLSTLTGDGDGVKMRFGLVGGAEFGYQIAEPFVVTAGALVSMQGANADDTNFTKDISTSLTYLNIPILANYYIIPGLAVKAGIQPGFMLALKHKWSDNVLGTWQDHEVTDKDGYKTFDLSIPLGLSYEVSDFVIDARYNLGITNINDDSNYTAKNGVIMLTVGYKIPL